MSRTRSQWRRQNVKAAGSHMLPPQTIPDTPLPGAGLATSNQKFCARPCRLPDKFPGKSPPPYKKKSRTVGDCSWCFYGSIKKSGAAFATPVSYWSTMHMRSNNSVLNVTLIITCNNYKQQTNKIYTQIMNRFVYRKCCIFTNIRRNRKRKYYYND